MSTLTLDCYSCRARGPACSDCVVSVLLGFDDEVADAACEPALGDPERRALQVLADSGMVPPLRLVPGDRAVS